MNPRSGSGAVEELREASAAQGVVVHVLARNEDPSEAARAAADGPVGVAGGDGSLAAVAAVCVERDLPFLCVPLGTRNHFARDLGLDRDDPRAALRAFSEGVERRVDLGRANGRPFLNNVSLGLYAHLVHCRERHRRRGEALARLLELATLLRSPQPPGLAVDGEPVQARALLVASNEYTLEPWSLGERERLDEGRLYLYVPAGLVRRKWWARSARSFVVEARQELSAAIDGEPTMLAPPVELTVEPGALRVLVPAPAAGD